MSFERSLSVSEDIEEVVNQEARAISINLLNGLTLVSPVDTGRFRGNWFLSLGKSSRQTDSNRRATAAVIEGISVIGKAKAINYPTIILSNNLPYGERLNDGYSTQAPKKFIEKEIDRVVNARNING